MSERDQELDSAAARHFQDLPDALLVEPSHDACTQTELGRLKAEMLDRHAEVHQAVVLVLEQGAGLGLHVHLLLDYSNHHRHLCRELVHAQSYSRLGQFGELCLVIHYDEFPRLRVACRRSEAGCLETFENMLPCHRLGSIFSVTLSFLD